MKISPIYQNYQAYKPSFGAFHECNMHDSKDVPIRMLCHTSQFFRYPDVDEHVIDFLGEEFKNEPLNILSLGCSEGEEVYSLAMICALKGILSDVKGIDIDYSTIEKAKKGVYQLTSNENYYLLDGRERTREQIDHKRAFRTFFEQIEPPLYDPRVGATNKFFKKKEGDFKNCSFEQGNVFDCKKKFDKNSFNAVFFRNVMYHLFECDDYLHNTKVTNEAIEQIEHILKPNGVVVFAPFEVNNSSSFLTMEKSNDAFLRRALFNHGFLNLREKCDTVWQKP